MIRKIAAVERFLTPEYRRLLTAAAEKNGFLVDFYEYGLVPKEKASAYEVLFGLYPAEALKDFSNLRWYCTSFAGVNTWCDERLYAHEGVLLSNSSGAYGVTLAEHTLMVTLMLMRRMPHYCEKVRQKIWEQALPMRSICGSRITVLGTGDVGTAIALRAKALGAAHIIGVRRSNKSADACFDEVLTYHEFDRVLPDTQLLIMALPGTAETANILNRARIALLPQEAYVVNVGRGSAVDQQALIEALNTDRLAGAALDVTAEEPPAQDDPLWATKNLLLTPHIAGQMTLSITCRRCVEMFCEDLANYAQGKPLAHLVDRSRGY